ncbi:hypothetical protein [Roseovarius sp.]|uniref:hypothetical protein n=1 Tax=Roseovarius sp. TaxID=1486281 RepID=UPI003D0CD613
MSRALLIDPQPRRRRQSRRNALLCALGLAILSGLALTGAASDGPGARQGFSAPDQSPSFMPETVRLRTPQ